MVSLRQNFSKRLDAREDNNREHQHEQQQTTLLLFTMVDDDKGPSFHANYATFKESLLVDTDGGLMLPKEDKDRVYLAGWLLDLKEGPTLTDRQDQVAEIMTYYKKTRRLAKYDWIWYGRFSQLLRYQREYHTLTVSKRDEKHKKLRAWLMKQREFGKADRLDPKRKEMLWKIGFDFNPCVVSRKRKYTPEQEDAWNDMFQMLVDYKTTHGHCNVGFYDTTNKKLALWITNQRTSYKCGSMSPERQDRLDSLGFVWSIRGTTETTDVSSKI
jgi:hypothetical protein